MIRRDTPGLRWTSLALAFFLMLLPLPEWLAALRPFLLALVMVYWVLETPQHMGLGHAFLFGLLLDLASFSLLGENALRLLLIAAVVHAFRNQFRFYPVWQQSMLLLAILYADLVLLLMLRAMRDVPGPVPETWFTPVLAFLLWPWLYMLLDNLRLRSRSK